MLNITPLEILTENDFRSFISESIPSSSYISSLLSPLPSILSSSSIFSSLLSLTKTKDQAKTLLSLLTTLASSSTYSLLNSINSFDIDGNGKDIDGNNKDKFNYSSSLSVLPSAMSSVVSIQAGRGRGKSAALVF
jgi:tRNA(Met) C34 N-acetyltransferase TmcA